MRNLSTAHYLALGLQNTPGDALQRLPESVLCEKEVNVRAILTSGAIAESSALAHEFSNLCFGRSARIPRVGMPASSHRSRHYSAGS